MLTQDQLELRKNYICGSDSSVICGVSPYKNKVQLWLEKTGRTEQEDISEKNFIKFGNFMEDGIAKWFEYESKIALENKDSQMIIHPKYDWMAGNIDFKIKGQNAILECKSSGIFEGWGDGENIVPPQYLLQVAHYCAVGNFDRAYIAVVFSLNRELRWYVYDRNMALEETMIKQEEEFWFRHVKADTPPEPATEQEVLDLYKQLKAAPIISSPEIEEEVYVLNTIKEKIKELKAEEQKSRDKLTIFMGQYETLLDSAGMPLASWKYTKPNAKFDSKRFEKEHPEQCKPYMLQPNPVRQLRIKGNKDE